MAETEKLRLVLDTNVIVSAGSSWVMTEPPSPRNENIAQQIICRVAEQHVGLVCGDILGEYLATLIDDKHPIPKVQKYITYLIGAFTRIEVTTKSCSPAPVDPDDVVFILCAIDGKAHYLVTDDNHLLAVREHYNPPKIRKRYEVAQCLGLEPLT